MNPTHRTQAMISLLAGVLALLVSTSAVFAQTERVWSSPAGGAWEDAANRAPADVPNWSGETAARTRIFGLGSARMPSGSGTRWT
jgi:hypothetical protein